MIRMNHRSESRQACGEECGESRAARRDGCDGAEIGPELRDRPAPGQTRCRIWIGEHGFENQIHPIERTVLDGSRENEPVLTAVRAIDRSEVEAIDQSNRNIVWWHE